MGKIMKLKIALLAFGALTLSACGTVPQENCFAHVDAMKVARDAGDEKGAAEHNYAFNACRASQGDKTAMLWLGEQFERGSAVVEADQEQAFKFYLQAATDDATRTSIYVPGIKGQAGSVMSFPNHGARPGLAEAKYRVGLMYQEGRGTKQNTRLAIRWMKRAAKQDHEGARNWLEANT